MREKGFTIAEVLITLGIIGIISALTIPTLVQETQKKVWANSLSAAVSNFETAMHAMIAKENVQDLYETEAWKIMPGNLCDASDTIVKAFGAKIGQTLKITGYCNVDETYINEMTGEANLRNIDGSSFNNPGTHAALQLKQNSRGIKSVNDIIYWFYINESEQPIIPGGYPPEEKFAENGSNMYSYAGFLAIDVNGKQKPNTIGRDIFKFVINSDGKIFPIGGKDFAIHEEVLGHTGPDSYYWKNNSSMFACSDGYIKSPGWGCTARLVENNYKMDY